MSHHDALKGSENSSDILLCTLRSEEKLEEIRLQIKNISQPGSEQVEALLQRLLSILVFIAGSTAALIVLGVLQLII